MKESPRRAVLEELVFQDRHSICMYKIEEDFYTTQKLKAIHVFKKEKRLYEDLKISFKLI